MSNRPTPIASVGEASRKKTILYNGKRFASTLRVEFISMLSKFHKNGYSSFRSTVYGKSLTQKKKNSRFYKHRDKYKPWKYSSMIITWYRFINYLTLGVIRG